MGSSKTLQLLIKCHNLKKLNKKVILLKPCIDTRNKDMIVSRTGLKEKVDIVVQHSHNLPIQIMYFTKELDIKSYHIMIDECQFLSCEHIKQLRDLAFDNEVICYGLLIDFTGKLFKASSTLVELSDIMINTFTECFFCGKQAKCNAKYNSHTGEILKECNSASNIDIGGDEKYVSCCWKCWTVNESVIK